MARASARVTLGYAAAALVVLLTAAYALH